MKKLFLILFLNVTLFPLWGQGGSDSLRYSQENGTLEKQRFIDQYDYVFMTKEPTKWMLKMGVTRINGTELSNVGGTGILGVEYKLTPSLSIGFNGGLATNIQFNSMRLEGETFARWYYNMNRRIKEGRNANNFSGNYVGLGLLQFYNYDGLFIIQKNPKEFAKGTNINLFWGVQRRFFQHGWANFQVSLSQFNTAYYGDNAPRKTFNGFALSTSWQIGLAFGDIRKNKSKPQNCDVFKCMETQRNWLKIRMPYASISTNYQAIGLGAAFEHRVGNSPFSIVVEDHFVMQGSNEYAQITNNQVTYTKKFVTSWLNWANLELRYYILKKRQIASGKSVANLSGIYAGLNQGIGFGKQMPFLYNETSITNNYKTNYWTAPLIGIQQRLFKNGFIDFKIGFPIQALSPAKEINRVTNNVTDLKLGFSF